MLSFGPCQLSMAGHCTHLQGSHFPCKTSLLSLHCLHILNVFRKKHRTSGGTVRPPTHILHVSSLAHTFFTFMEKIFTSFLPFLTLSWQFCFPFHSENRSNQKRSATSFHYAHASPASASTLPRPHGAPPSTGGQPCTCVPGLLPLTVLLCCATPPPYPAFPLC